MYIRKTNVICIKKKWIILYLRSGPPGPHNTGSGGPLLFGCPSCKLDIPETLVATAATRHEMPMATSAGNRKWATYIIYIIQTLYIILITHDYRYMKQIIF